MALGSNSFVTTHFESLHATCSITQLNNPNNNPYLALRVAAICILLIGSTLAALLPVLARRSRLSGLVLKPRAILDFAKYFGSGVIIGTAFIHLLAPGIEALTSPCLTPAWQKYPYALGLCLCSILALFLVEILTMRWGMMHLAKTRGAQSEVHNLGVLEDELVSSENSSTRAARVVGIAILEFGTILHSVLIGLTLAAAQRFKVLFGVLVTHQVFEGLGIGSRLASVDQDLPARYSHLPIIGAVVFGLSTPLGLAVGLAVRTSYSPNDPGALIVSGVLDSLSAGILIYTGLVELLAHEILFNDDLMKGSSGKLALALLWVFLGCCVMALLGKWV
ncbi:ZIP-like iron-zinc transporter [Mycena crocata]|nr:ZIP-like iron-zinc transporter [Mycena crocata]